MSRFTQVAAHYIVPAAEKAGGGLRLSFDIEGDGLLHTAKVIHCIVMADLDSNHIDEYGPDQIAAGLEHLRRACYLAGHNILTYDLPLLKRLYNWTTAPDCTITDTLVCSRLILPAIAKIDDKVAGMGDRTLGKLRGRHSIEAWGIRLEHPKAGADIEDWSRWTPELQQRCVSDAVLSKNIWRFLQPDGYSREAVVLEHRAAVVCEQIMEAGVPFNRAAAQPLYQQCANRCAELEMQLDQQFQNTNLNSRAQIGVLLESRGWVPESRTEKTGRPQVKDDMLETIAESYPEFAGLSEYLTLQRLSASLATGEEAWCRHVDENGRIHGGVVHIGTPHSRAAHFKPNLAGVPNPKKGKAFGNECRALFQSNSDWVFVTADQASLQDRGLAHYLQPLDGGAYAQAFLAGEDTHWKTTIALRLINEETERDKQNKFHTAMREHGKRFRYAFLYGAQNARAGHIIYDAARAARQIDSTSTLLEKFFGTTDRPGKGAFEGVGGAARKQFEAATPGLRQLREKLEAHVERHGWVPGLDGRRVPVSSRHTSLNYIIASSEAIICKRWMVNVYDELRARFRYGWDGDVVIVLWIHDELVCCCRPEIAEQVGEILVRNAKEPGDFYKFRIPLDADYKVGRNWAGDPVETDKSVLEDANIDNSWIEEARAEKARAKKVRAKKGKPKKTAKPKKAKSKKAELENAELENAKTKSVLEDAISPSAPPVFARENFGSEIMANQETPRAGAGEGSPGLEGIDARMAALGVAPSRKPAAEPQPITFADGEAINAALGEEQIAGIHIDSPAPVPPSDEKAAGNGHDAAASPVDEKATGNGPDAPAPSSDNPAGNGRDELPQASSKVISIELTRFAKANGPLTKRISLEPDGSVKSDGGACVMASGTAQRLVITNVGELAAAIETMRPNEALALGALRACLPDKVQIVTKSKLNGQADTIARTAADINFRPAEPAPILIDFDTKGMPAGVAKRIQELGGFWPALVSVLPALPSVAHLIRRSTSAGLFRIDTDEKLPGSSGVHVYLFGRDGADIQRFLRALHNRCWLAGFGWMMVGAGGQLLERSIVDRMVWSPERLIFEATPILVPPLAQDQESRRPVPVRGALLDTVTVCPELSILEDSNLGNLKLKESRRLAPEAARAREAFIATHTKRLVERTGMSEQAARKQVERQCDGILLPDIALPFDDEDFAGCTVRDVLVDPGRFDGATLADPLEDIEYGRCKALIMLRDDGTPWIHSFAHGRTIYSLLYHTAGVRAAMDAAADADVVETFLKILPVADLNAGDIELLRNEAAKRSGLGKRAIDKMIKNVLQEQETKRKREALEQRLTERKDPRPRIPVPYADDPLEPQMELLNDLISNTDAAAEHPTARNIDGDAAFTTKIEVPGTYAFTDANPKKE